MDICVEQGLIVFRCEKAVVSDDGMLAPMIRLQADMSFGGMG
jgi:hypothetical protein